MLPTTIFKQFLTIMCSSNEMDSPVVMGIINVNDESFYSASRCSDISSFSTQFTEMARQGAGIIDIGACSTRPGSTPITPEEEWKLLEIPLKYLAECREGRENDTQKDIGISIDTFRSEIVRRAYDMIGDFIVNDISAGEDDPMMLKTVGELGLEYIAMHKRGTPDTMQQMCDYPKGVVREVADYFLAFAERAAAYGIKNHIIDPGFGFAKTVEQNYILFKGMPQLMDMIQENSAVQKEYQKHRLLVGISRKSMIYKPLCITPEESLTATAALNLQALMLGANILRVHDVREAVQCVKLHSLLVSDSI